MRAFAVPAFLVLVAAPALAAPENAGNQGIVRADDLIAPEARDLREVARFGDAELGDPG